MTRGREHKIFLARWNNITIYYRQIQILILSLKLVHLELCFRKNWVRGTTWTEQEEYEKQRQLNHPRIGTPKRYWKKVMSNSNRKNGKLMQVSYIIFIIFYGLKCE